MIQAPRSPHHNTIKYNAIVDGRCKTEIKTRIGMAKNAFNKRKELLSKSLNKDTKKRIIKAIIWNVALYAAQTWTYKKEDIRRLKAFEMWVCRKMEKSAGET